MPKPAAANGERHARVRAVLEGLERRWGIAEWQGPCNPVDELVACILSQHTSDANSQRAFGRLRERFAAWECVAAAPTADVADAIRCGGLADTKAPRIQAVLRTIEERSGALNLDALHGLDDAAAAAYLVSLPGVGPKTAAIVLCFALGRPVLPVDTHVFRVAWRLGLVDRRVGEARAHGVLQAQTPPDLVYRFHVAMVRHGRGICQARSPRCAECPLLATCPCGSTTFAGQRTRVV